MKTPVSDEERQLLLALAGMAEQYLGPGDFLDHQCMGAGETAVALLIEYGLVEPDGRRGGAWTEAGKRFLNGS